MSKLLFLTKTLNSVLLRYLKQYFRIAEGNMMVFTYVKSDLFLKKDAMMNYDVIWNCREFFENKDTKSCILNLFETKFAEKF